LLPTLQIAAQPRKASQIQRFQYLWLGLWSLSGLSHFVLMLVPVFFLTVGLKPVPAFDAAFLKWFAPYTLVRLSGLFLAFPGATGGVCWRRNGRRWPSLPSRCWRC
ncbi:MAG: hypothetical protein HC926_01110, partial [Synechococcaceae cyanobacterium SM2_3_60]|nr:hypothetical protein [Synechococcaceae cyanobacterium SM2_3_60]